MTLPTITLQGALLFGVLILAGLSRKVILLNEELLLSVCVFAFAAAAVHYGGDSIRETLETRQGTIRQAFQQGILQQQQSLQSLRNSLVLRSQATERLQNIHEAFIQSFTELQASQVASESQVQRVKVAQLLSGTTSMRGDTDRTTAFAALSALSGSFHEKPELQKKAMNSALARFRKVCTP